VKDINGKDTPLYRPITASAYSYGMGAFLLGVVSIPYGIIYPEVFMNLTYQVLYPLAYAVFISSSLCYALISYAAYLTSATIVTAFWPLQVPVATIESFFCVWCGASLARIHRCIVYYDGIDRSVRGEVHSRKRRS